MRISQPLSALPSNETFLLYGTLAASLLDCPLDFLQKLERTSISLDDLFFRQEEVYQEAVACIKNLQPWTGQLRLTPIASQSLWINLTLIPQPLQAADAYLAVALDITDSVREHRLLGRMIQAVNNSPESIFIVDKKGHLIDFNNQALHILPYSRKELLRLNFKDLLHRPSTVKTWTEYLGNLDNHKQQTLVFEESAARNKKGFLYPLEIFTFKEDFDGQILAIIVARDISERQKAREQEQRLRAITQHLPNIALFQTIMPKEGKPYFSYFSNSATQFYQEALGKTNDSPESIRAKIHPDDVERLHHEEKKAIYQKKPFRIEIRYLRDGNPKDIVWMDVRSSPQFKENGDMVFNGLAINITEQKAMQERLEKTLLQEKKLNHALEQHKKDIDETNESLSMANDSLRQLNKELDTFIYSISHDLKAPLSSVKGLLFIAKNARNPEELAHCFQMIDQSLFRMESFIKDILDYSRNARVEITPMSVEVERLIEEVLGQYAYMKNAPKVEKEVIINGGKEVKTDRYRLTVILNNLLSNSLRYARLDQDRPFLRIEVTIGSQYSDWKIEDNGLGIPKEHQDKVFEMFYRAHEGIEGSGMGLYLVKETIIKLGGKISLSSTEGKGTTIVMQLPHLSLLVKKA